MQNSGGRVNEREPVTRAKRVPCPPENPGMVSEHLILLVKTFPAVKLDGAESRRHWLLKWQSSKIGRYPNEKQGEMRPPTGGSLATRGKHLE